MRRVKEILCGVLISLIFLSCESQLGHKELVDFNNYEWAMDDVQSFEFEIMADSLDYEVNYLLRNAIQYPFYNIYLKSSLKDSSGNVLKSGMEELILFDEKTGKPLGDGLGDLFDHRINAAQYKDFHFPYVGKYSFEIQHNMRPDTLVGVLSVGFEVLPKE